MILNSLIGLIILSGIGLSGCSHFSIEKEKAPKKLEIQNVWTRNTYASDYSGYRRLHRVKPVMWRDSVITGNSVDSISSYDRDSGKRLWQKKVKGGVGTGISLSGNRLYFGGADGYFYAVSVEDGETLWTYPIRSEGIGSATVLDGVVYFISGDQVLHALNQNNGQKIWSYNRQIGKDSSIYGASRPAIYKDKVYAGFADGHLVALEKGNGGVVWDVQLKGYGRFRDIDSSPLIDSDRIYTATYDGAIFSISLQGQILWQSDKGAYSDLLIADGKVYFSSTSEEVVALDKTSGKVLWVKSDLHGVGTSPAFFKNILFVGETRGDLLALDPSSGEKLANYSTGRGISSPILFTDDGLMFLNTVDANLNSLRVKWVETLREWPWED